MILYSTCNCGCKSGGKCSCGAGKCCSKGAAASSSTSGVTNYAFVFIKPHANNAKVQALVKSEFKKRGIEIITEGEMTGEQIDEGRHIDQHYYAIASKATLVQPKDLPVDKKKFQEKFNVEWEDVLKSGKAYTALDACKVLGVDAAGLDKAWAAAKKADKLVKLGGGFYAGLIDTIKDKEPIYTFNGFFMSMRSKFVLPGTSIHYYSVKFPASKLSWSDFRGKVLGPTDPATAPADSLRGLINKDWVALGLDSAPNTGDNGVHASASPFEGLAERCNWLKVSLESDPFGRCLLDAGLSATTIKDWSVDPAVKGKSIFDQLEDTDADVCLTKMKELAK